MSDLPAKKPKTGGAVKKIDEVELKRLAELHITNKEIAQWFSVHEDTLGQPYYAEIIKNGKSLTKQRLKQKAIQRALQDNSDTMLIFCLKNYCGWSNNDNAKPIEVEEPAMTIEQIDAELAAFNSKGKAK